MSKFTLEQIEKMFPRREGWGIQFDYGPVDEALGKLLVTVEDNDWQGETRLLLQNDHGRFGMDSYSWGSCSHCDFAQGCQSHTEMLEYANQRYESIKWLKRDETIAQLKARKADTRQFDKPDADELRFIDACLEWFNKNQEA